MTPERFSLPSTPVPEDELLSLVLARVNTTMANCAMRYEDKTKDPALADEDYYQHMFMLLFEWVSTHREKATAMLASTDDYLERFISTFCQRRMRDLWATTQADRRDAALTFHASHARGDRRRGGSGEESLLESLAHARGRHPVDPESAGRVQDYYDGLTPLARRIMETLVDTPTELQQAFLKARTRVSKGRVQIDAVRQAYGRSRMVLTAREGPGPWTWAVTWEGPLVARVIQTSHGDMTVSDETDLWRFDFPFPLMVLSDGHKGTYEHTTIRPTPSCFDIKAMARYLAEITGKTIPNCHVQAAWNEARAHYRDMFGGPADWPEPELPRRRALSA